MKALALILSLTMSGHALADNTPSQTLEDFLAAIPKEDRTTVVRTLDAKAQIYESGYVEQSRDEYLSHHFAADAEFARAATTKVLRRNTTQSGDTAVIWSETVTEGSLKGKPIKHFGTETVVLKQIDGAWRIIHVHWSSRKPS